MKTMAERLKENVPYNLFFTTIADSPETLTQKNAVTFTDLLCPSLGEIKCSLQPNFLVEVDWLMEQYEKMGQGEKPLTLLYGYERDYSETHGEQYSTIEKYAQLKFPNVKARFTKGRDSHGIHHSKVGIFVYNDNSLRVVISTANLYSLDWTVYCNGLWISPLCPPLPENSRDTAGAGPAYFKPAFLTYLRRYNDSLLTDFIDYVKRADFSAVKVCLVTSAPGLHKSTHWPVQCHLHRVGELLSLHCKLPGTSLTSDDKTTRGSGNTTYVSRSTRRGRWTGTRGRAAEYSNNTVTSDDNITARSGRITTSISGKCKKTTDDEEATATTCEESVSNENEASDIGAETTTKNKTETEIRPATKVSNLPKEETANAEDESLSWEIITQASSIGYLGNSPNDWLRTALLRSLASHTRCRLPSHTDAAMKIVYPTENDVLNGYYGAGGGGCLCYWMDFTQENQKWPSNYLCSWKADNTNRSKATPHIKTYCRISPCLTKLAWFLLTSANISKSAWGSNINKDGSIYVRSYEVGVLFLPKYFGESYFKIKEDNAEETEKLFPFIFDIPLIPYGSDDEPWTNLVNDEEDDEDKSNKDESNK